MPLKDLVISWMMNKGIYMEKEFEWKEDHRWENQILSVYKDYYSVELFYDEKGYSVKVYFDDICGNIEMVDYKEFATLEEAMLYSEKRISRKH